jgi:hypothetical protein
MRFPPRAYLESDVIFDGPEKFYLINFQIVK